MRACIVLVLALGARPVAAADCVVLLHGLARGPASMAAIARVLEWQGYAVVNAGYPSTRAPIQALLGDVGFAVSACGEGRVHFVTHSMGGILLRAWMTGQRPGEMGRVVMLGPPNAGSELVDELGSWPGFDLVNGAAGLQLGTGPGSLPLSLPPVDYPVGVIAGVQSVNPFYSVLIPGPDDGKVALQRTAVDGMADHIALPVTHTFMMWDPVVIAQTLVFLRTGAFDPGMTWMQAVEIVAKP
jgi:pimeloyl-ACP methyl ester carboxylesterase